MSEKGIVLLVEDNQKILDINRRLLEKEGIMVLTAKTLAEARERIKLVRPDVTVLDIMLPDGSGIDFLAELKESVKTPVLFLTAKAERTDVLAGLTAGGNDYITKPYDIDEFRARVINFLRLAVSGNFALSDAPEAHTAKLHAHQRKKYQNEGYHVTSSASVLSEKELAVALYAAQGLYNKEIAVKVNLSESRIKTCLSGIYRKLGISDKRNKRRLLAEMLR